ncbi:sesquiterpene cyclase [Streptomyces sp. NPDC099050]|uniref:terpene synthase family protein n=1 Tax=Streptomyces sp. NPDC099050 TaxID=3366100 RepID=UPI00381C893F
MKTPEGETRIPRLHIPIPYVCNPLQEQASRNMWEWLDSYGLVPAGRARERTRRSQPDLSAAITWIRADLDLLTLGAHWLGWAFRVDDQLDEDDRFQRFQARAEAIRDFRAILHGEEPVTVSPLTEPLRDLWGRTSMLGPAPWRAMFLYNIEQFFDTYVQEARLDELGHTPILRQHIDRRVYSVGMLWMWDPGEADLVRLLPDDIRNSEALYRVRRAAALQIALVNDIFGSVRDEFTGYQHNAVGLLRGRDSLSYQEAFDVAGAMADEQLAVFLRERATFEDDLARRGLPDDAHTAVMEHLDQIAASVRGQHSWHVTVEQQRYALDDLLDPEQADLRSYPDDLLAGYQGG